MIVFVARHLQARSTRPAWHRDLPWPRSIRVGAHAGVPSTTVVHGSYPMADGHLIPTLTNRYGDPQNGGVHPPRAAPRSRSSHRRPTLRTVCVHVRRK